MPRELIVAKTFMSVRKLRIPLLCALVLSGCQIAPLDHSVALGNSAHLKLARYWPEASVQQLQMIRWSHPQHDSQQFLVSSYLHAQGITVIGFSPLGQELWRAELSPEQPLQALGIAPFDDQRLARAIISDLQLQQWPVAVLEQHLHNATLVATESMRQVTSHDGTILWEMHNHGSSTTIHNYVGEYQLTVELLDQHLVPTQSQDDG